VKKPIRLIVIGAALAAAALLAVLFLFKPGDSFSRLAGKKKYNVVLITLDTIRADRLACYGFQGIRTPFIDRMASRGLRYERCFSQTPLTLPSHTTILSGTFPPFHSVRDNGGYIVPAKLDTLAEQYKARGYGTAAFVAAYVLDSRWGLNQGFDYYFDNFDLSRFEKISLGSIQRPGNEVVDQALEWLADNKDRNFFTWIHLYDPHTPYEPPPPFDQEYPGRPYLGEIAFADSQIGRLWDFLEANGLLDSTFLVLAGDHGESLGQHEETTHGFFVYQEAIHVPLIIVTPFKRLQGRTFPQAVTLADITPTLLDMTGLPIPSEVQGRSLVPGFFRPQGEEDELAYSETYYPRYHFGWSELRAVQDRRYKLILAPELEFYDLDQDPGEKHNLAAERPVAVQDLRKRAEALIDQYGRNAHELDYAKMDEDTREKLAALGYVGAFTDPNRLKGKKLANPRDKIGVFNRLTAARELGMGDDPQQGVEITKGIIASDPDITEAYFNLGNIYFRMRKFKEAISSFQQVLDRKPDDSFSVINIANSYMALRQPAEAEKFILTYLKKGLEDSQLFFLLGGIFLSQKKYERAVSAYKECLLNNSESASAHNALAAVYYLLDDLDQAESHIQEALRLYPKLSSVHFNLAQIQEKRNLLAEAETSYRRELEITPSHFKACYNLARLYRQAGDETREEEYLNRAVSISPDFPLPYLYLARLQLNRGQDYRAAVDLVKKAIGLHPDRSNLALAYFLLADLYSRLGEEADSNRYARLGQETARAAEKAAVHSP
jgi:arylsulfatase A-like enzyme/Tfp pilus assembly protein PilF